MPAELQTIAALVTVAVAVVLLVRAAVKAKGKPGRNCGCPTDRFKKKLRR